jgi:hypothetical protein
MGTLVRVTINDEEIARLFLPPQSAWRWMEKVGREQYDLTVAGAPVRTGDLKRSFNLAVTPNGKYQARYTVGSYSPHATYVIFGTTPPIYGSGNFMSRPRRIKGGKGKMSTPVPMMRIRAAPHSWFLHPVNLRFVDGQMANDFMGRAADVIIGRYA